MLPLEEYQWKTLSSHHPHSIRVQRIGQDIIGALLKELKKEEQSMNKLEEFEWEFIVVDDPDDVNAECSIGGKIVVFNGLLDYFKTDAEIAAIIGHEIGHAEGNRSLIDLNPWMMKDYLSTHPSERRSPFLV
ncbi:hypothetical protein OROHE_010984 [Orobanche hederae]